MGGMFGVGWFDGKDARIISFVVSIFLFLSGVSAENLNFIVCLTRTKKNSFF